MGAFMEPFFDAAKHFARFVAHVLLIAAMRYVIENVADASGVGLLILDCAENVAIAVAAIRSFWPSAPGESGVAGGTSGRRSVRRVGFL